MITYKFPVVRGKKQLSRHQYVQVWRVSKKMNAMQFPMAPIKLIISKAPMNMIDFLAIVPFYLSLLLEGLEDFEIIGKAGKIIRLVKVTLVVRIVVKHSSLVKKKMHILLHR